MPLRGFFYLAFRPDSQIKIALIGLEHSISSGFEPGQRCRRCTEDAVRSSARATPFSVNHWRLFPCFSLRRDTSHSSPVSLGSRCPLRIRAERQRRHRARHGHRSSGAVIPNATVALTNEVSGFDRTTTTDATGQFTFPTFPSIPTRSTSPPKDLHRLSQNVEIRSSVGIKPQAGSADCRRQPDGHRRVRGDLIEDDPTFHTDVDRDLFTKVPLESAVLHAQLAGHADHSRRCGRLQRPLSRPRRPRLQLLLRRRPGHHRPAEQGLLQPASVQLHSIH